MSQEITDGEVGGWVRQDPSVVVVNNNFSQIFGA
jgi:hypothetical protein